MRLYLVRHAEATGNPERRYIGWEDLPLTPEGERQARALAGRLAQTRLTAIHCSDLRRAVQTAHPIAAAHHISVVQDPGLREVNFGEWSGLTYEEIAAIAPDHLQRWLSDPERCAPPGGETLAQLRARALAALPRQDGALVVSHGGALRAVLSHLLGCEFWAVSVPPASFTVLDWDGERVTAAGPVGETAHLKPEEGP